MCIAHEIDILDVSAGAATKHKQTDKIPKQMTSANVGYYIAERVSRQANFYVRGSKNGEFGTENRSSGRILCIVDATSEAMG